MKSSRNVLVMILAVSCFFTSCLTGKKMDRYVAEHFGEITKPKTKFNNVIVTSSLITEDDKISTSKAKTCQVVPLLFYNQWNFKNTCSLNPQIPINTFIENVQSQVNKNLIDELNGQTLALHIEKMPNSFSIEDKNYLIFFGVSISRNKFTIKTEKSDLVVAYKLLKNGVATKNGVITIPYVEDKHPIGMFVGWKKAVTNYLIDYNIDIAQMSKMFVQKLAAAL